jgi:hypothetical protein
MSFPFLPESVTLLQLWSWKKRRLGEGEIVNRYVVFCIHSPLCCWAYLDLVEAQDMTQICQTSSIHTEPMSLRYRIEKITDKSTQVLFGSIGEYKDTLLCLASIYIHPPFGYALYNAPTYTHKDRRSSAGYWPSRAFNSSRQRASSDAFFATEKMMVSGRTITYLARLPIRSRYESTQYPSRIALSFSNCFCGTGKKV